MLRQESGFSPVIKAGMATLEAFQMFPDRVLESLDTGSREAGGHIVQLCCQSSRSTRAMFT
jgi:hypothetical protein